MTEAVREWMVRGIAAAKTGREEDRPEALSCLERVLRSDYADPELKKQAWLLLGELATEPERKRICFQSVLSLDPGNGTARQGLAILDGTLEPEDILGPHESIEAVPTDAAPRVQRSTCPQCGGKTSFDADLRKPVCEHCGKSGEPLGPGEEVQEQDFFAALPTAKARQWELPSERVLRCAGCGASFALPPLQMSGSCPFCTSPHIAAAATGDLIQPQAILPFQFDAEEAWKRMLTWMSARSFRPPELSRQSAISRPNGIYVPFWTFDLGGTMSWRALVAERQGRTTKWVPRDGLYLVYHDDLLVPASRSLPEDLLGKLLDFKTEALVPYSSDLLADYAAEIYQVPLANASLLARQRAIQVGRDGVQGDSLHGETVRDFVMNSSGLVVDSYKLVLLPVWIATCQYKPGNFPILVNGQTGTVSCQIPRNWMQKALAFIFGGE